MITDNGKSSGKGNIFRSLVFGSFKRLRNIICGCKKIMISVKKYYISVINDEHIYEANVQSSLYIYGWQWKKQPLIKYTSDTLNKCPLMINTPGIPLSEFLETFFVHSCKNYYPRCQVSISCGSYCGVIKEYGDKQPFGRTFFWK